MTNYIQMTMPVSIEKLAIPNSVKIIGGLNGQDGRIAVEDLGFPEATTLVEDFKMRFMAKVKDKGQPVALPDTDDNLTVEEAITWLTERASQRVRDGGRQRRMCLGIISLLTKGN